MTSCDPPATGFDHAREVALAVRESGGRALIVGGWVRDMLMGRPSTNIDLEVFGLSPDRVRPLLERLGRVEAVGESFQVYKLGDLDVSLPRRDSKAGRGHRGFIVTGDPTMSIEERKQSRASRAQSRAMSDLPTGFSPMMPVGTWNTKAITC